MRITDLVAQLKPYLAGWLSDRLGQLDVERLIEGRLGDYVTRRQLTEPGLPDVASDAVSVGEVHPTDCGGALRLWLRADALSLSDGASVALWPDASGNGYDAAQGTSSKRPVFATGQINGLPAVRFDGSNDSLVSDLAPKGWHDSTLFLVCRNVSLVEGDGVFSFFRNGYNDWSDANGYSLRQRTAAYGFDGLYADRVVGADSISVGVATSGWALVAFTLAKSGTARATMRNHTTSNTDTYSDTSDLGPDRYALGARFESSEQKWGNVDLAEVVFLAGENSTQRAGVLTYLARKYRLYDVSDGDMLAQRHIRAGGGVYAGNVFATGTTGQIANTAVMLTPEGGLAVLRTAGESLSKGHVLALSTSGDNQVVRAPANSDLPAGVAYADASSGANVWVVVAGLADVLFKSGVSGTRGYVAYMSDTIGVVTNAASIPGTAEHWREIGHVAANGASGGLARCVLHFN